MQRRTRAALAFALAMSCVAASAQSTSVKVSGQFDVARAASTSPGCTQDCGPFDAHGVFDCTGYPVTVAQMTGTNKQSAARMLRP